MNTATRRHGRQRNHVRGSAQNSYSRTSKRRSFSGGRNTNRSRGGSSEQGRGRGRKMPTFDPSQFINTNPVEVAPEVYDPKNTFKSFGLSEQVLKNTTGLGLITPSPIQDQIIPLILSGRDVVGLAQTGTGKTAAFLLPLIHKIVSDQKQFRMTLILAPTRELAIQIETELRNLTRGMNIYATVCVGGVGIGPQIKGLRRANHFVIGTPGRVLDLIERKSIRTDKITTVVLDEADRMLDMGFINDMRRILSVTPKNRETLLFSATMSPAANDLVNEFLKDPVTVSVKKKDVTNSIEQNVVRFDHHSKFDTLVSLLNDPAFTRVIIFGAMKHSVEKLAKQLSQSGVRAESIHGNKAHGARQRALKAFKDGHARVLVATDVAARGIHVEDVSHVINYDLPNTFEDYVHRIGRTGRRDKHGKALTFVPA